MEDKDKAAASSRPATTATEFTTDSSSWALGPDDSDGVYFFSAHRDTSNILSEFGWNLDPEQPHRIGAEDTSDLAGGEGGGGGGGGGGLWFPAHSAPGGPMEPTDKAAAADVSTSNNQSVSSSSSEDQPEKSTVSEEKPPEIP